MRREWGLLVSLGFLMTVPPRPAEAADGEAMRLEPGLTLRVYNYAGVPQRELALAMRLTLEILSRAGVSAEWIDCLLTSETNHGSQVCGSPKTKAELDVRIPMKALNAYSGLSVFMLGFTTLDEEGNGSVATVFYERVTAESSVAGCSRYIVLGYAIAHEVGHLLLGTGAHSPAGIMIARWDQRTLEHAAKGWLFFTRQQAEIIRKSVERRGAMSAKQ